VPQSDRAVGRTAARETPVVLAQAVFGAIDYPEAAFVRRTATSDACGVFRGTSQGAAHDRNNHGVCIMATVIETVLDHMKKSSSFGPVSGPIAAWVESGELKDLKKVKASANFGWIEPSTLGLLVRDDSEQCHRMLAACLKNNCSDPVTQWMKRRLASPDAVLGLLNRFREWELPGGTWAMLLGSEAFLSIAYTAAKPTYIGQWLLKDGAELIDHLPISKPAIDLMLAGGAKGCATWLKAAAERQQKDYWLSDWIAHAIRRGGAEFIAIGKTRRAEAKKSYQKFQMSSAMAEADAKWNALAVEDGWDVITKPDKDDVRALGWMYNYSKDQEVVSAWLAEHDSNYAKQLSSIMSKLKFAEGAGPDAHLDAWYSMALGPAIAKLGSSAGELWLHLATTGAHEVRVLAIKHLLKSADTKRCEQLAGVLGRVIDLHVAAMADHKLLPGSKLLGYGTGAYRDTAIKGEVLRRSVELLGLITKPVATLLLDQLLSLFAHASAKIRSAAMSAAIKAEGSAVERVAKVLSDGSKDARVVAARALSAIGTPAAIAVMESRLGEESADEVRAALFGAIDRAWQASGRVFSDKELEARVARVEKQLSKPWAGWLNAKKLPKLAKKGGGNLPESWVSFLLWRQFMHGAMTVDPEARPIWEKIDHAKAADFGVAVLEQFMASKQDAKDKWALAIGGLLGDDRTVKILRPAIDTWAAKSRGALAEHAATAIALVNSEVALATVDDVGNAYRVKNKNIGAAANAAFEAAATARGMTPDELGDAVVPWLAFKPGAALTVDVKGEAVGVRVGLDGKLVFRAGGKDKSALPTGAGAPVKEQIKNLAADMRGVMKAQVRRHARMLVQQRRWPAAAWAKLYLSHPLLVPFLTQLIWAEYDKAGRITKLFRGLPDGTLTDVEDEKVPVPTKGQIGLVHPLELDEATIAAWRTHVVDYEVVPPVPQLERASIRVQPAQATMRTYSAVMGVSLNALTFKGRAERLGWRRGSVADAGGINVYLKQFPAAGVDVVLGLDGMFIGVGVDDSITLREAWFVKGGSVSTGGYTYDEPSSGDDPRVIAFGDVPPIVFSETMAELTAISGKATDDDD
jgi:hypothetical protein